eukprot:Phypoly_transcript_12817.p1 GENE.Phypoly_transcript_12817~~Phypoly_transcript_12817.p1  ORF type:complete len:118 (+),score=13.66 Phypoly_transcript_12817:752-1105(+)
MKRMVWNTQYDVNEHTLLTLDTEGNTLSSWSTEEDIVSITVNEAGFWYIYSDMNNFQLAFRDFNGYLHSSLLNGFEFDKSEFIMHQIRTNLAKGSILILGKEIKSRQSLLVECKLQQ